VAKTVRGSSFTVQKKRNVAVLIGKGVLLSIAVSLLLIIFLSLINLLTESSFVDRYMQYIMVGITIISIFIGSVFATLHVESMGLVIGIAVGIIYVLISVAIGMKLSQESISLLILANKIIAGFAAGALGGLVGVNLS
jgi:putative membrane protein (TIGR04086 family)